VARKSILGLLFFVAFGLVITAILAGETRPPAGMAAYFVNGQIISEGRHSLDLSKPIFLRGGTPVCDSEDSLENYSPGDSDHCKIITIGRAAGLVGIQTDGMREPSFEMQMQTPSGSVKGWVDYNNLRN